MRSSPGELQALVPYASKLGLLQRHAETLWVLGAAPPAVRDTVQVQMLRAAAQARLGRIPDAIATLQAASQRFPRDPGIRRALAQLRGGR